MDIIKLAEALGVNTTCSKEEIQYIREYYGVGIQTAREIIIEPKIYKEIELLVKCIKHERY